MTSRFVSLVLVAVVATVLFPNAALAQTDLPAKALASAGQNKQGLVFEINNLKLTTTDIADAINGQNEPEAPEIVIESAAEPLGPVAPSAKVAAKKTAYSFPPKVTGDARVYMQEPEIRAYVCPKLGDKCNIFIAVLKAENGTHECTRDNRGLNKNGSVDIGLAQINWKPGYPHSFEQLQDCKYNLDVAISMYQRRGFQPWYAYTKGAYKKHLPAVIASAKALEKPAAVEPITN